MLAQLISSPADPPSRQLKLIKLMTLSLSLRRSLQLLVVLYVTLYQLWYAQGYQEFSTVESSTTTKVVTITLILMPKKEN